MRLFAFLALWACFLVGGCVIKHRTTPPAENPGTQAPSKPETPQQREIRLTGELAATHAEVEALRLAPLRTTLAWSEGIALLGLLASVGLAAAALFWGLGFTWKIPAGFAIAFAFVLVTALFASWALNYVAWIVAAVLILSVLGVVWLVHKHMTVASATKALWNATPDDVLLPNKIEALLDHISK